jgi:hypothetical protein
VRSWNSPQLASVYAGSDMADQHQAPHAGWLKIGGIGCAAALALTLLALGTIVGFTFRGYERELTVREELDRRHGAYDSYRVPVEGTVPADRLTRFLAVRRVLMPRCSEVTEITGSFRRVEAAAASGEPDVGEIFRRAGDVISRMPRMGLIFGAYVNDRNRALLDQGMGLGEYTWIYVVGYFAFLGQPPMRLLEEPDRLKVFEDRVYPEFARVIDRHVRQAGLAAGPWVEELARLRANRGRVPFVGNLPAELAGSLEPSRAALGAVACPAAAELDMTITVRRGGIGYDHR